MISIVVEPKFREVRWLMQIHTNGRTDFRVWFFNQCTIDHDSKIYIQYKMKFVLSEKCCT